MKLIQAINYINYSVKEGYLTEEQAEDLMNLKWQDTVTEVEKMIDRADNWAESVIKGEI